MDYLERYRAGEYRAVWSELLLHGGQVRTEPLYSQALAVAQETMQRVGQNISILYDRLKSIDYRFSLPELVICPPDTKTSRVITSLENQGLLLPMSLRAFYETVGSVWFLGYYPLLSEDVELEPNAPVELDVYSDPLAIIPPDFEDIEAYKIDYNTDKDNVNEAGELIQPYAIGIAPDEVQKAGYSGGGPFEIYLPESKVDALIRNWSGKVTFVEYLRICCQWGGFPGLRFSKNKPEALLNFLTEDLLPF